MLATRLFTLTTLIALVVGGCGVGSAPDRNGSAVLSTEIQSDIVVESNKAFPNERCLANQAAGTIIFLTGFDIAAAASIIDVVVADAAGYFEAMCLDVEIRPGLSSSNFEKVADQSVQFASSGSFSEVVEYSLANEADLLVTTVEGRTTIDTLIVKSGEATELDGLAGRTIGVKGKLPPSIDVMLRSASLVEGTDFDTIQLDGFDPVAHLATDDIIGIAGWKSNEVGFLDRAGVGVQLFDPLDFGVPGSFGVIYTSTAFINQHPTAAQDFVRATAQGLADAVADPASAAEVAVGLIERSGNPSALSPDSETYRWETEAGLILEGAPEGMGLATPDIRVLQAELDAYAEVGLFGDVATPTAGDFVATGLSAGVHDDAGAVVWPS